MQWKSSTSSSTNSNSVSTPSATSPVTPRVGASEPEVIRNVIEEAVLADQVGVDFFGVGEHHRDDFAISAPKWHWLRSRAAPTASGSARRSPCSVPTIPCVLPALRHARRGVQRPGRGDPRSRVVHRVLPAVRLRPRRLRDSVRGEARSVRAAAPRAALNWTARPALPSTDCRSTRAPSRAR